MNAKDLSQIKEVVRETIKEENLATKKDLQKLDKKFDGLFNFLDKDYLRVKQNVRDIQSHLHFPISDF